MIASWMVYAVLVGLLVSVAALAAERALLLARRPVRGVWAAALLLSLVIPAVSPRLPWHFSLPAVPAISSNPATPSTPPPQIRVRDGAAVRAVTVAEPGWGANKVLLTLWGAGSGLLALFLVYAMGVLQGRRREWRRESLDGVPVLVSRDVGPAVIGWHRLDIVMPEWVRELAAPARSLVLRHEMEHVTRRDPRLLLRAFLVVVAMPWNPVVWWQLRRLRRAIELDCDARVVASGADVARYGSVLLDAVGRCNRGGLPAFAAFAERPGDLEARIRALTAPRPGFWRGRAVMAATAAVVLAAAACLMPDSLAPGLASRPVRPVESSLSGIEWLRVHLWGLAPADIVILYRNQEGALLGSERMVRPSPGARPVRQGPAVSASLSSLPPDGIESVEVLRGEKLGVPGIDGVVVVTVKGDRAPGAAARLWITHELARQQQRKVELAMAAAGPPPEGSNSWQTYIWFETDSAGIIRGAGYVGDKVAMIRRNGRRPAESGSWYSDGLNRKKVHWARYVVP